MTQKTQFLMVKESAAMHVQPEGVDAYLADGWAIVDIKYSEGGEGVDTTSQVLMVKDSIGIRVRPASVATYQQQGYRAVEIKYGTDGIVISDRTGVLTFLDTPSFASAEVGTVDATTLVVVFSTEVTADDYAAGVTIEVDEEEVEISSATRQTDHTTVHYVIPAVENGAEVTWSYDDDTGGIVSEVDSTPLDDVSAGEVTNNVPE